MTESSPVRVIDLYAGAGGLAEGFRRARGYHVVAAVESDEDAAETLRANHPATHVDTSDIRELGDIDVLELADGPIDVVVGGPPCQGFSVSGQRRPGHESEELLFEFSRLVEQLEPAAFLIENVPGLLSFRGGLVMDRLLERLRGVGPGRGFDVTVATLDAARYGVPQHRRRVFIVGTLDGSFGFPQPVESRVTLYEAIGDLPRGTAGPGQELSFPLVSRLTPYQLARRGGTAALHNHSAKRLEALRRARIAALRQGQDRRALPDHLQSGGREGKYRRLQAERPSPTILAHMARDTSGFIHPYYNRMLTVREAARLQSFDDRYVFLGSQYQQFRQVGNAVPPLLAEALARALELPARRSLEELQPDVDFATWGLRAATA